MLEQLVYMGCANSTLGDTQYLTGQPDLTGLAQSRQWLEWMTSGQHFKPTRFCESIVFISF